ncbi:hypothetical protein H311_00626 [Anncaliia algerae PRA109]|nr:hypothetical protein H311_00626 [Anncaliia algerae PRA109]
MIPKINLLKNIFFDEQKPKIFIESLFDQESIFYCPEDNYIMTKIDQFKYKCRKKNHRKIYSLLKGTIFENKSMPFLYILFLSYLWVSNITHMSVKNITSFSENTIVKINKKNKKRIAHSIKPESLRIGGPGIFVELDESKFGKRKYNRGNRVEGAWVFTGVEKTEERKCFAISLKKEIWLH